MLGPRVTLTLEIKLDLNERWRRITVAVGWRAVATSSFPHHENTCVFTGSPARAPVTVGDEAHLHAFRLQKKLLRPSQVVGHVFVIVGNVTAQEGNSAISFTQR